MYTCRIGRIDFTRTKLPVKYDTFSQALIALISHFSHLEIGELEDMREELIKFGYYRFNDSSKARAAYCEVVKS